ncbi:hypothetical protein ALTERO38_50946 [Alteromonas sp. 38]|nr:hypothetical protein ALTER154_70128 [Alteromonas sp. 154]VXB54519.1 hypothetical protein ALTERO38_50946 [Alteromonas sp. 38]
MRGNIDIDENSVSPKTNVPRAITKIGQITALWFEGDADINTLKFDGEE